MQDAEIEKFFEKLKTSANPREELHQEYKKNLVNIIRTAVVDFMIDLVEDDTPKLGTHEGMDSWVSQWVNEHIKKEETND